MPATAVRQVLVGEGAARKPGWEEGCECVRVHQPRYCACLSCRHCLFVSSCMLCGVCHVAVCRIVDCWLRGGVQCEGTDLCAFALKA